MSQVFGSASLIALAQNGIQSAEPAFFAGSACVIQGSFYDNTGAVMVPATLQYRIDDECSGAQILSWTSVTPQSPWQVEVTAIQNAMISLSRRWEKHQVLVQFTDPSGNGPFWLRCLFDLLRVPS